MDWIKNGLAKPQHNVLVRSTIGYFVARWDAGYEIWIRQPGEYTLKDCAVTHFAIITEPTDAKS